MNTTISPDRVRAAGLLQHLRLALRQTARVAVVGFVPYRPRRRRRSRPDVDPLLPDASKDRRSRRLQVDPQDDSPRLPSQPRLRAQLLARKLQPFQLPLGS